MLFYVANTPIRQSNHFGSYLAWLFPLLSFFLPTSRCFSDADLFNSDVYSPLDILLAMIRLEPSVISLAPSDLLDYEDHSKERELQDFKKQFACFEIGADEGPKFGRYRKHQASSKGSFNAFESLGNGVQSLYTLGHALAGDGHGEPRQYHIFAGPPSSDEPSSLPSRVTSPENFSQMSIEVQQPSPPPKDGFHYGGFVESSNHHSTEDTLNRSSPFGKSRTRSSMPRPIIL